MPTFDTPGPIDAAITLAVGETRIVASDRGNTVVEVAPSDPSSPADEQAAARVRVEYGDGRLLVTTPRQWRDYSPFSGRPGSVDVLVELPAGSAVRWDAALGDFRAEGPLGTCRLTTSTGHVTVGSATALSVRTPAGDVTVEHVTGDADVVGSGHVRVTAVDGAAAVQNLNGPTWVGTVAGDVTAKSANGEIVVERAGAAVSAKTANGDIRIGEVVRGAAVLKTGYGNLSVGVREGTAARIDLKSHFGRVRNLLQSVDGPAAGDDTVEVTAHTSYGDVTIERSGAPA